MSRRAASAEAGDSPRELDVSCIASYEVPLLRASTEALPLPGDFSSRTSAEVPRLGASTLAPSLPGSSEGSGTDYCSFIEEGAIDSCIELPGLLPKSKEPVSR